MERLLALTGGETQQHEEKRALTPPMPRPEGLGGPRPPTCAADSERRRGRGDRTVKSETQPRSYQPEDGRKRGVPIRWGHPEWNEWMQRPPCPRGWPLGQGVRYAAEHVPEEALSFCLRPRMRSGAVQGHT